MFARVCSMGVYALEGFAVNVEADISGGLPQFAIVGLPDNAVKEATDRVRSALKNLNYTYPVSRITINLAPADIKKTGPVYDLPVLLAILAASGQIKDLPDDTAFVGELSLDGSIRGVNGILPMTIAAQKCGKKAIFVPSANALEASAVEGIKIYAVENAKQVVLHLLGENVLPEVPALEFSTQAVDEILDFADVRGQLEAKRALEIAAAGGHNLLMVGSPGSGKSMLAKRLPGILPPLTREEAMETTKIYSVAGNMKNGVGLITQRPFRAPHHSVSATGLSGGGATPRPGEISLAHNGVLFLDELPEFHRDALEILRQPVEDGIVTVSRVAGTATFPCQIMLIAAMNPCPCGYFGHPTRACTCNQSSIDRYLQRISGPLLDRIDLHVEVLPVDYEDIASEESGECSADIAVRVAAARAVQLKRFAGTNVACNAQIPSAMLRRICRLSKDANKLLKLAFERMGLSARAYDRVLKVSRTIADLDGSDIIDTQHVSEAVQYRNMDRKYWYTR
ncbi:MAG: YifB family Mg chelatase-like AAA ATPase [Oscillospiraceae bacterium]